MTEQTWIDASSFLIRRIVQPRRVLSPPRPESAEHIIAAHPEQAKQFREMMAMLAAHAPVEVESITTYDAALNVEIPSTELLFVPPNNGLQ